MFRQTPRHYLHLVLKHSEQEPKLPSSTNEKAPAPPQSCFNILELHPGQAVKKLSFTTFPVWLLTAQVSDAEACCCFSPQQEPSRPCNTPYPHWSQSHNPVHSITPHTVRWDGARLFPVVPSDKTRGNGHKLNQRKLQLKMRKTFFPLRGMEPWNRLPREAVESPSLEIFQTRLDAVLCSLLWVTLLQQDGWTG